MTIQDLIPGATYMVNHTSDRFPENNYNGLAVYQGPADPEDYVADTLVFTALSYELYIGIEEVSPLTQHQGSVTDQLNELYRIATKLKLYDAADWLKARIKT